MILDLQIHLNNCYKKQIDVREQLKKQQASFQSFETLIMKNINVTLCTFFEFRTTTFSQQYELASDLSSSLKNMNAEADWSSFITSRTDKFITPDTPIVEVANVIYDGHEEFEVKPIKQGPLLRKEGVIVKSYKPIHCVLTQFGYFHIMPAIANGEIWPDVPDTSIDLTECSLQPLMMNEKDPEEIAFLEKGKGIFGGATVIKHKV